MRVGEDLLAVVTGGTRAHIGAVALAEPVSSAHPVTGEIPRFENTADAPEETGAARLHVPVLEAAGHKDAVVAQMFARALCEKYGVNVCCSAGIHIDGASAEAIALLVANAQALLKMVWS
jgi:hypothetical protein